LAIRSRLLPNISLQQYVGAACSCLCAIAGSKSSLLIPNGILGTDPEHPAPDNHNVQATREARHCQQTLDIRSSLLMPKRTLKHRKHSPNRTILRHQSALSNKRCVHQEQHAHATLNLMHQRASWSYQAKNPQEP
jgi:hypothetical protein